jgi:hypothetical protein
MSTSGSEFHVMTTRCHVAIGGFRSLTLSVFLTVLQSTVANAGPLCDDTKRAILPSHAATTTLKRYVADGNWDTAEWPISSEDLDLLEVALAPALMIFIGSTCQRDGKIFA